MTIPGHEVELRTVTGPYGGRHEVETSIPRGMNEMLARQNAEKSASTTRYYAIIRGSNSTHEEHMWARVHARRAGILWPEQDDLATETGTVLAENKAQWEAQLLLAEEDVTAFLKSKGLER